MHHNRFEMFGGEIVSAIVSRWRRELWRLAALLSGACGLKKACYLSLRCLLTCRSVAPSAATFLLHSVEFKADSRRQMNIAGVACGGPTIRSVDFEGFRLARGEKDQVHVCSLVHTSTHTHVDVHMSRNR